MSKKELLKMAFRNKICYKIIFSQIIMQRFQKHKFALKMQRKHSLGAHANKIGQKTFVKLSYSIRKGFLDHVVENC